MMALTIGDVVTRWLAGTLPMLLRVTEVRADRIVCGAWEFDPACGAEIDEDIGWGPPPGQTGSFIEPGDTVALGPPSKREE
mgnify:CR=1 FL=1